MINLKEHMDLFNIVQEEYKKYCSKQICCNDCKLYRNTGDKMDCFKKFYTMNIANFEEIYNFRSNKKSSEVSRF